MGRYNFLVKSQKPIWTISLRPRTPRSQPNVQAILAEILKTPSTILSISKNPLVKTSKNYLHFNTKISLSDQKTLP